MSERLAELVRWEASGGHWEVASDDGAVVRLYVDSSLVYEEVLDGRRWRDRCIGAL
jgi:hypothetical protein